MINNCSDGQDRNRGQVRKIALLGSGSGSTKDRVTNEDRDRDRENGRD